MEQPWSSAGAWLPNLRDPKLFNLFDKKLGLDPYGFQDEIKEQKFLDFHLLTFTANYKGFVCKLFGAVSCLHLYYTATNALMGSQYLATIISGVRCAFCASVHLAFSHRMAYPTKILSGYLSYYIWFLPVVTCVEFSNPETSLAKVLFTIIALSSFGHFFLPKWSTLAVLQMLCFWVPCVRMSFYAGEHESPLLLRGFTLLFAGCLGPLWSAVWSVKTRREWARGRQQARKRRASQSSGQEEQDARATRGSERGRQRGRERSKSQPHSSLSLSSSRSRSSSRERSRSRSLSQTRASDTMLPKVPENTEAWRLMAREGWDCVWGGSHAPLVAFRE